MKIKKINKQKCLLDKATEIKCRLLSAGKEEDYGGGGLFWLVGQEYKVRTLQKENELKWRRE